MAEIINEDITTGHNPGNIPPGDGVFDQLMFANQVRLEKEYRQTRLRGPDYAKVYLGTMEAIMQQSIAFLLGRQEADKKAELLVKETLKVVAETLLVEAQTVKTEAETDLLVDKLITEALNRDKTDAEILGIKANTALTDQKILTEVETTALVAAKVLTEGKQQLLIDAQISKLGKEEQLIDGQIEKMAHEIQLMLAQVWVERAKVSDDVSITVPPIVLSGLMGGQIRKIDNEGKLLAQKVVTEEAQTQDIADPESVIGKQIALYEAQKQGFSRDAEQKLSKIMVDSWNTRRVTDDQTVHCGTGLEDPEIKEVLKVAKEGIGYTAGDHPCNAPTSQELLVQSRIAASKEIAAAAAAVPAVIPPADPSE